MEAAAEADVLGKGMERWGKRCGGNGCGDRCRNLCAPLFAGRQARRQAVSRTSRARVCVRTWSGPMQQVEEGMRVHPTLQLIRGHGDLGPCEGNRGRRGAVCHSPPEQQFVFIVCGELELCLLRSRSSVWQQAPGAVCLLPHQGCGAQRPDLAF